MAARQSALQGEPGLYEALAQKAAQEIGEQAEAPQRSWWQRIDEVLVGSLAFGALALCAYNVIVRYFHPAWTLELVDEVQVYVIVWAVLLALGAVTVADRHVKADLFVNMFPPALRRALELFIDLLGLAFAGVLLWYGSVAAWQAWSFGDVSITSLRFPLWIYVAALPAGALSLAIGYVIRLRRRRAARS